MKKLLVLPILALFVSLSAFAQEEEEVANAIDKKHEVRLGAVKLLAGGIFEGVYEYVQDSNRGFGASVLFNFNTEDDDYQEDYSITPYYRMYFQTKEDYGAKGFFVEGFTSFFGGEQLVDGDFILEGDTIVGTMPSKEENYFDISVGLALGKKWINSTGFVFEIKFGAGRNLLNASEFEALFKGDLYVGYRF